MTLGDVVPALQQGTIDGGRRQRRVDPMHFNDAAKYVTNTGSRGFRRCRGEQEVGPIPPADLQKIVDATPAAQQKAIGPIADQIVEKARKGWTSNGGELIGLPADEQAQLMTTFSDTVAAVAKEKPALYAAYKVVSDAAKRVK